MPDGNGPAAISALMSPIPFAFRAPRDSYKRMPGPCDEEGLDSRVQLQEMRYAIQLWTFGVAAPGNDAIIAAGTRRQSFVEGVGDAGTELGWGTPVLTQAQCNLFPQGSLNNADNGAFVGRSIGLSLLRPFVYNSTTGERTYSELVDSYAERAGRALLESLELSMFQRDNETTLYLGLPQHWPGAHQLVQCDYATLNKANGALAMFPLRRDYVFIDDNKGSQNYLIGTVARQLTIDSDPADPIPAGFSIPVMTEVYGEIVSRMEACDVPGSKSSKAQEVKELIAAGLSPAQAYDLVRAK